MRIVQPTGPWGRPVLAGPAPRLLPPSTPLRPTRICRVVELADDALVITAQVAALAEVFQPPAFTVLIRGHGHLTVTADLLGDVAQLCATIKRVLAKPCGEKFIGAQTSGCETDSPISVGLGEPRSGLVGAGAHVTAAGMELVWAGLVPAVDSNELQRAVDATARWLFPSSPVVAAADRHQAEIWIGQRRWRPDLVRQALTECGAHGITVDLNETGLGVTAALPVGVDARSVRAAVHRRLPAHGLINRWELSQPVTGERPPLLDALLEVCRVVLEHDVQPNDDFFALGGNSLSATHVLHLLRERAGVQTDLPEFLRALRTRSLVRTATMLNATSVSAPPIPASLPESADTFPLTPQQQAYVMGRGDDFASGGVSCHTYLEFEGTLDDTAGDPITRFEHCWRRLHARHPMLRVRIDQTELLQRINPLGGEPPLQIIDLTDAPPESIDARLVELRDEISHRVGPLEGPLHLVRVIRLARGRVRVCFSFDALIVDLASMGTLFRELDVLWEDPELELPTTGVEFSQCVAAESQHDPSDTARARAYWDDKLANLPPAPEFPAPAEVSPGRFLPHPIRIDASLWQRALQNAADWGITASALVAACHGEVLSQWATSQRFTVNLPRFNRRPIHPNVAQVVGEFASITLIVIDRTRPESFGRFARDLQEQIWADLAHDQITGIEIMRRLRQVGSGAGGNALMPVVLTAGVALPGDQTRLLGGRLDRVYRLSQTPQVDIDCIVEDHDGGLVINWDHRRGAIDTDIVVAMAQEFARLVSRLADPDAWSELDPTGTADRANRSELAGPSRDVTDRWSHEAIWDRATEDTDAPALVGKHGTTTRGALTRWAQQIAAKLIPLPAGPVAVALPKGPAQIAAVLGIVSSGRAYVPLDPTAPTVRSQQQAALAQAVAVITPGHGEEAWSGIPVVSTECSDDDALADPVTGSTQGAACAIIFTSGSTGTPKGTVITHAGIVNCVVDTWRRLEADASHRFLAVSALHHDMSMYDVFGVLGAGGVLVLPEGVDARDTDALADLVERHEVTGWVSVPALVAMLAERATDTQLASLRHVLTGGDWVPRTLCRDLTERLPELRVISVGGPTETTMWNIWHDVAPSSDTAAVPYGQPMSNTTYHVMDERLRPRPMGVTGELVCSGAGVAAGYLDDPEQPRSDDMSQRFAVHPVSGQRICRTGDRGLLNEATGPVWFRGRADGQVKINGYRVELAEVEQSLQQDLHVQSAIVVPVPRDTGVGYRSLAAFVTGTTDVDRVRAELTTRLPREMVPTRIVPLDELPLTRNGKVDRTALLAGLAADHAPVTDADPLVDVIARFCSDALGTAVGPDQDLFMLGADSLMAAQLATRVDAELPGLRLAIRDVFATPTARTMAAVIGARAPEGIAERIALIWQQTSDLDTDALEKLVHKGT